MKKLLATVALAASLIGTPAYANMVVMGPGWMTCQQFNAIQKLNKSVSEGFFFWAQGFMSATNMAAEMNGGTVRDLNSIPLEKQQNILRRYCIENPTEQYATGVLALLNRFDDITDSDNSSSNE